MGAVLSKPALDTGIVTVDFDRMIAFYRDVLGFPASDPITFPGVGSIHRLEVGQSILRLFRPEQAPAPVSTPNDSIYSAPGIRYMTLLVDNIDEVAQACRDFGVRIGEVRELRPGVRMTTVQDPDGNWMEIQSMSQA